MRYYFLTWALERNTSVIFLSLNLSYKRLGSDKSKTCYKPHVLKDSGNSDKPLVSNKFIVNTYRSLKNVVDFLCLYTATKVEKKVAKSLETLHQ